MNVKVTRLITVIEVPTYPVGGRVSKKIIRNILKFYCLYHAQCQIGNKSRALISAEIKIFKVRLCFVMT